MNSPTIEDFIRLQGQAFSLQLEGDDLLTASLVEVMPLQTALIDGRQPFSLVFAGPPMPVLPQQTYRVSHALQPALDIFLVPIAADALAVRYQAIFN